MNCQKKLEERVRKWNEEFDSLTGGISATMVWSYKYGMLITPSKMKEIRKEEMEYRERHTKEADLK